MCRAQRREITGGGPVYRAPTGVGLQLHQDGLAEAPPSASSDLDRRHRVVHRFDHVLDLLDDRFQGGRGRAEAALCPG